MVRRSLLVAAVTLVLAAVLAAPARGATPGTGRIAAGSPRVTWSGSAAASNPVACFGRGDTRCDHFALTIEPVAGHDVRIAIDVAASDDWDVYVYAPDGSEVGSGASGFVGADEVTIVHAPVAGTYEVRVQPYAIAPGASYKASAMFVPAKAPVDTERDCYEDVPDAITPVTPDPGGKVQVNVAVLADGVDPNVALATARRAAAAYTPINVQLAVASVTPVAIAPDKGGNVASATRVIADAKRLLGGRRPAGTDAVYVITAKDLYDGTLGDAVAGMADCIGGVEHATTAFAVGEVDEGEVELLLDGGPVLFPDTSAKVLAHEVAHLLGGQHHYATCGEGLLSGEAQQRRVAPCTLMSNFVDLQAHRFSTVNAAVVRAHASEFARP